MFSLVGVGAIVLPVVPDADGDFQVEIDQKFSGQIPGLLFIRKASVVPVDVRVAPFT